MTDPTDAELLDMVLWQIARWRAGKHTAHQSGCRAEQCVEARARGSGHPPKPRSQNRYMNAVRAQDTLETLERLVRARRLPPDLGGPPWESNE